MERSVVIRVRDGLHARPATRFVKLAKRFASNIEIFSGNKSASAKSSVRLMLLSIKENDTVIVKAEGADESEAIDELVAYLSDPEAGLDDEDHEDAVLPAKRDGAPLSPSSGLDNSAKGIVTGAHQGVAASGGYGLGPAFAFFKDEIVPERRTVPRDEIDREINRFETAVAALQSNLRSKLSMTDLPPQDRGILSALIEAAGDDMILSEAQTMISAGCDAISSTHDVTMRIAAEFAAMDDTYLQARAEDIRAIGRHICLLMLGKTDPDLSDVPHGAIILAQDLSAFDLAAAPLSRLGGLICAEGAATSHVAIIARTHAIPAVLGLGHTVSSLRATTHFAIDGHTGLVYPDPDESLRNVIAERMAKAEQEKTALASFASFIPKRKDGTVIEIAANLGSLNEIDAAQSAGAMGVGLFRTELLFMQHRSLPDEEMQLDVYSKLAAAFAPYPVIIRTLDIGGDKPVAGVQFPREDNPFLGWRGIRMCLDCPDLFKTQLRALLRAAVAGNVKVMLPMVSDISEITRARALIAESIDELKREGKTYAEFSLGIMIETPAAVMQADEFSKHVAFFSIGTNDLTQYVMAADRMNPALSALCNVENPAVMSAIAMTAKAGLRAGIMVGMCGEAAARQDLLERFIEMGISEFSMSPSSILATKKYLHEIFG